ncbi:MAG: hypothetical protein OEV40_02620 [Acidimicrobiia bacterium]|nr:hypothetical protein [Acidimicrobiia bacterium]
MSNREPVILRRSGIDGPRLADEAAVFDFQRAIAIVRRRWRVLLLPPILFTLGAYVMAGRQASTYEASALIALQPTVAENQLSGDRSNSLAERELQTEAKILDGAAMSALVSSELGSGFAFDSEAIEGTDLLQVTATGSQPSTAASTANAIVGLYIEERRTRIISELERAATEIDREIAAVEEELALLDRAAPTAASVGVGSIPPDDDPARSRQRAALEDELSLAIAAREELQAQTQLTEGGVRIAAPAVPPRDRISPNPVRTAILWGMLGLLVGLAAVWLRDRLDSRIRTIDDVGEAGEGIGYIDVLPKPDTTALIGPAALLVDDIADRLRVLATAVVSKDDESRVIQVAGIHKGAGASFVATNLAVTLAMGGWATVLVDADLADGELHGIFGLERRPGLKQLMTGDRLETLTQAPPQVEGLGVISTGSRATGANSTLHSTGLARALDTLRSHFDVVVVDGPAVPDSGEASILSNHSDTTLLVGAMGRTSRSDLEDVIQTIALAGGTIGALTFTTPSRTVINNEVRRPSPAERRRQRAG